MTSTKTIGGDAVAQGKVLIGNGPTRVYIISGNGSPEGVEPAPVGSMFLRIDGGPWVYIKESGGNTSTGWVAEIL